jgi:hypothetical protein
MAHSQVFQEFGRDVLAREAGEIGMHLHAWDSPPLIPLTPDDNLHHPYLIEYPEDQMREKVWVMTHALEDTFGVKPTSHRAGRWSFDERYARILVDHGYLVDCSVTPHMSWKKDLGDPARTGGTDFSAFPDTPYFLDLDDISRPGDSRLLEVPVTVIPHRHSLLGSAITRALKVNRLGTRVANRLFPLRTWLYPGRRNRRRLLRIVSAARREQPLHLELTLHSSELMPGGSPTFPTRESIELWYETLEELFEVARGIFEGATLSEFYEFYSRQVDANAAAPSRPA